MTEAKEFESNATKKKYKIIGEKDCNSKNVIYQLDCKYCKKQYIGQTSNPLRVRMTGHRADISHQDEEKPVGKHAVFHQKTKLEDCYKVKTVKQIKENNNKNITTINLRQSELAHQLVIQTRHPSGLNLR